MLGVMVVRGSGRLGWIAGAVALAGCIEHGGTVDVTEPDPAAEPVAPVAVIPARATLPDETAGELEQDPAPTPPRFVAEPAPVEVGPELLEESCLRGKAAAREDAAAGTMHVDVWGYPASCAFVYWDLLAERYEVGVAHHGCVVTPEDPATERFRRCYEQEVDAIVRERHGDDAYERLHIEAQQRCHERSR